MAALFKIAPLILICELVTVMLVLPETPEMPVNVMFSLKYKVLAEASHNHELPSMPNTSGSSVLTETVVLLATYAAKLLSTTFSPAATPSTSISRVVESLKYPAPLTRFTTCVVEL